MKNKIIKIMIITLLLNGCASSKLEKPTLDKELNYNQNLAENYSINESWWLQFNNEELNSLINLALENNPDYLKAAYNVERQLYNLDNATVDLFPTLNGSLSASSQREISKHENFRKNFSGEVGLNYELDLYGKIRDARDMQSFEYEATILDRDSAKLSLINNIIDVYFNLVYLNDSIKVTNADIKNYASLYQIVDDKYLSGKIDSLDVTKAKQALASEKIRLLDLQTQFNELEGNLKSMLNLKPEESLNLSYGSILKQNTIPIDVDVPLSVLANRPDLKASQYRLEKSFKNLSMQEKNWYPNITLRGALGSSSDKARSTFDFPYILGSVGLDLPFLDWARVNNNIKISEVDYKIELTNYRQTLTQALNETAYYLYAYQKSVDSFDFVQEKFDNSVLQTIYYRNKYDAGNVEFRYLLEALNTENSSKIELLKQKYMVIKYQNYVYKSLAGKYEKK